MRRTLIGLLVGVFVGLAGLVLDLSPRGLAFERNVGLTWLFKVRGPVEPPRDVVVVAMDGRTGDQLGLPLLPRDWPRSVHATLVEMLVERGASVIAFDVHFGTPRDAASDQAFVDAVVRAGNVVLVELLTGKRLPITDQAGRHVGMVWTEESLPPFPGLAEAAAGLASFPLPKEAAAVHQFWVFKESTDQAATLPAVALQLHARDAVSGLLERAPKRTGGTPAPLPDLEDDFSDPLALRLLMRGLRDRFDATAETTGRAFSGRDAALPLEEVLLALYAGEAHRYLNFYGPPGTIQTIPYHAILKAGDPNLTPEALDLAGKVVFVGYSDLFDPGQPDRFYTVFTRDDGVDLSGVEIAATAFANLLTDRSLDPVDLWTAVALLLGLGLILGMTVYLLPAAFGVPVAIALLVGYAVVAQHLFVESALILPIATPLLVQGPLALFLGLLGQYFLERRRGQRISAAINYYLPETIVHDLVENRLDPAKLNQVVYSTCFATDMAGFSTIAEKLPPGELAAFLNDYFETLAAPLKAHKVHVTEFRADAIMCAWTSDQPSADPRRQALLAALEAGEAIKAFQARHDMPGARLRIGLEAGWVYVGHAGGGGRFVYSIVGDSANTASRVEGLNKHVGTQILATGSVVAGFENLVTRYLGAFQFVGKSEAVPIHEVLAKRESADDWQLRLCEAFDEVMAPYWEGRWVEAAEGLKAFLAEFPQDGPAGFFLARCDRFLSSPGEHGDPHVIRMDAK
ncbi:MAG: adenylate/guanylate cyclase domain-containing protein [Chromatiaceae bacterium]|jgi:adenylate cyclase|nr:adenylate/guanylate cyclase domain-containing protein [Chromatiaceae bacterium]